jgi:SAM-dependent methyltransferase
MATGTPNEAQIEYWNGPRGEFWVTEQELRDQELAAFGDAALRAAAPRPGESVVDVGCGCGATTLALADLVGEGGFTLGVDVSEPMLARARQRAAGRARVRFERADAASYPFDGSADLVFSRFGVMFFDEPEVAFANLRRALRPGGRVAFVCWRSLDQNEWMSVAFDAVRKVVPPSRPLPSPEAPGPLAFARAERVVGILERAGFAGARFTEYDHAIAVGGGRGLDVAALDALTVGPTARYLADASEADRARALEATKRALAPRARGDVIELNGAVWIVTADAPPPTG